MPHLEGSTSAGAAAAGAGAAAKRLIFQLLSLFHPNAFTRPRFGPRGCYGVIVGKHSPSSSSSSSSSFTSSTSFQVDVVFRVHAEFQLNREPELPFWFTPAQFVGRLVLELDAESVIYPTSSGPPTCPGTGSLGLQDCIEETQAQNSLIVTKVSNFQMFLPTHSSLNVDMEWMNPSTYDLSTSDPSTSDPSTYDPSTYDPSTYDPLISDETLAENPNEVDIGFVPKMKIVSEDLVEVERLHGDQIGRSIAEELITFDDAEFEHKHDDKHDKKHDQTNLRNIPPTLTLAAALKTLENQFYPFKFAVEYLSFPDAVAAAATAASLIDSNASTAASSGSSRAGGLYGLGRKPLHAILLWGSLDDQSC